jgi:hypothetical protein
MSRYFIQMELHKLPNKTVEECEILHAEMAKKSFYPTVTYEGDNNTYLLPTGSYRKVNDDNLDVTKKDAKEAGHATVNKSPNVGSFSFFLVEYSTSKKFHYQFILV